MYSIAPSSRDKASSRGAAFCRAICGLRAEAYQEAAVGRQVTATAKIFLQRPMNLVRVLRHLHARSGASASVNLAFQGLVTESRACPLAPQTSARSGGMPELGGFLGCSSKSWPTMRRFAVCRWPSPFMRANRQRRIRRPRRCQIGQAGRQRAGRFSLHAGA